MILLIGSPVRYRDMPYIVHGFTPSGLVKVWRHGQMYCVRPDRLKRGWAWKRKVNR